MTNETVLIRLTVDVVAAHVGANSISTSEVPALIKRVYGALGSLGKGAPVVDAKPAEAIGAVSVRKSLADRNFIISMLDGRPYKTLRRHLSTNGTTPTEYRERYNLPKAYPMTAPAYSAVRSEIARAIGFGRKAGTKIIGGKVAKPLEDANAKVRKVVVSKPRGRKPKQLAASMTAGTGGLHNVPGAPKRRQSEALST